MIDKAFLTILLATSITQASIGQQPAYTKKYFASVLDTSEFKLIPPSKNGYNSYFIVTEPEIWDTDDNNTTHVRGGGASAVVFIEGNYKNGKKEGVFSFFLIDSLNHSKRYKIWEQTYANDKLNGEWKTFNLKGTIVKVQNYKNDSLSGSSREFLIDGKTLMEEREYKNGGNEYIARSFYKSGKLQSEQSFKNGEVNGFAKEYYENGRLKEHMTIVQGVPNGTAIRYYEDGTIKEEAILLNGNLHNKRKYYYPNGKIWIEQEYKNGMPWTILANYDQNGNIRNAGTLREGNGTVLLYNEDGSLRETLHYVNGQKQ